MVKKTYFDYLKDEMEEIKNSNESFDEVVLYIPRIFELLCNILDDDTIDRNSRLLISSSLGYLVNPNDVLPEEVYGAYGYMDDLYALCIVLRNLDADYKDLIRKLWQDSDYDRIIDMCISRSEKFLDEKNLKEKLLRYCGFSD